MMLSVGELARRINGEVRGDHTIVLTGAQSVTHAAPDQVAFVTDEPNLRKLAGCRAGAVILSRSLEPSLNKTGWTGTLILVDDATASFIDAMLAFRVSRPRRLIGISKDASVSASARIGENTNIHPGASVGEDVIIGENCDIHPGVSLGAGCRLGDNVAIHPNAVIYPDVVIGNRVIIQACAVIGADGFGYRQVNGRHEKIPQLGTVRIEDDVEVGACATIDRAMIGETVIGEGTKVDNLVAIGHNCQLGRHNIFVSQVGLAGSVTTGDYVVCAGQVGVADHVHLGERSVYAAKSGIHKDMPPGQSYFGSPAEPAAVAMKQTVSIKKLPELRQKVTRLESKVAELSAQISGLIGGDSQSAPAA